MAHPIRGSDRLNVVRTRLFDNNTVSTGNAKIVPVILAILKLVRAVRNKMMTGNSEINTEKGKFGLAELPAFSKPKSFQGISKEFKSQFLIEKHCI